MSFKIALADSSSLGPWCCAVAAVCAEPGPAHAPGHPHLAQVCVALQEVGPPQVRKLFTTAKVPNLCCCPISMPWQLCAACMYGMTIHLQGMAHWWPAPSARAAAGRRTGRCARCCATTRRLCRRRARLRRGQRRARPHVRLPQAPLGDAEPPRRAHAVQGPTRCFDGAC